MPGLDSQLPRLRQHELDARGDSVRGSRRRAPRRRHFGPRCRRSRRAGRRRDRRCRQCRHADAVVAGMALRPARRQLGAEWRRKYSNPPDAPDSRSARRDGRGHQRIAAGNRPADNQRGAAARLRLHAAGCERTGRSLPLLAGMSASGTTRITEPPISRDHTERMLAAARLPRSAAKATRSSLMATSMSSNSA